MSGNFRLKDIVQVAAVFALPLVLVEALHAWRTFRVNRRIIAIQRGMHGNRRSRRSSSRSSKNTLIRQNNDQTLEENKRNKEYEDRNAVTTCGEYASSSDDNESNHDNNVWAGPRVGNTKNAKNNVHSIPMVSESLAQNINNRNRKYSQTISSETDTNNNKKTSEKISDALFFPETNKKPPCKDFYFYNDCQKRNCTESHSKDSSIGKLLNYIFRARDSIDVCQYAITSSFLADAILARHRLGVKVRIVTDHEGANQASSQMNIFYNNGVQVRPHKGNGLMHNKYILIDKKIVISGSFNFTTQAITENYENLIVSDNIDAVGKYVCKFEELWEKFSFRAPIEVKDKKL